MCGMCGKIQFDKYTNFKYFEPKTLFAFNVTQTFITDDTLIMFITLQGTEPSGRKTGSKLWVTSGSDFDQSTLQWQPIRTQPKSICSDL